MTYEQILQNVADNLNLPIGIVKNTYRAYWQFIRDTIQRLPLKEDLSEEDFKNIKTNFNIPSLGKLYCTRERYLGVKKRFEYIKNLREKNAEG